jgi:signal transduction histidine kinase
MTTHDDDATPVGPCNASAASTPDDPKSKIGLLRFAFIISMGVAVAVCGSIAFVVVRRLENDMASQTFESVANSALKGAQAITLRKVQAGSVLASLHSHAFPNASQWPFVSLPGFADTAKQLDYISNSLGFFFSPIVQPNQATEFEAFAQQVYTDNGYPNGSGVSAFGFGIWARRGSGGDEITADNRTHDTSGNKSYSSKYALLVPAFQTSDSSSSSALMYNSFSDPLRGRTIGRILDCAAAANANSSTTTFTTRHPSCGVVSEFTELILKPGKQAAILYLPIFPVNDPTTVVGLISTSLLWEEVLTNVGALPVYTKRFSVCLATLIHSHSPRSWSTKRAVPDYVNGLVCVVSTSQKNHTYVIRNGVPIWVGQGDLHDRNFDNRGKKVVLNDNEISTVGSTIYTVTVYPSRLMLEEFHTNSPLGIALGFIGVILFSASLFFLYDFFMRHESHQRKTILEVKRRFVRFVSHEIRTPLNTVCLGLELLHAELSACSREPNDSSAKREVEKDAMDSQWVHMVADILENAAENANNAVGILNDLLNYDKIEQGTFKLDIGTVDIWSLVKSTVSAFRIQAEKRNIALELTLASSKPDAKSESVGPPLLPEPIEPTQSVNLSHLNVYGDNIRLQQVLRNLISNALKFSPEFTGVIQVTSSYKADGLMHTTTTTTFNAATAAAASKVDGCHHPRAGSIVIVVQDNGVGMTREQLSRLFHEGVQFDPNKHQVRDCTNRNEKHDWTSAPYQCIAVFLQYDRAVVVVD